MKPSWATMKLMVLPAFARLVENVARAGDAGREFAAQLRIAAPELPRGVAKAVVPLGPGGGEIAKLIAARPDVPRLGDQPRLLEHGIVGKRREERRARAKAALLAPTSRRQVEAEAVNAAPSHPALQRRDRHVDDGARVEPEAIAGAAVVDVGRKIVRRQAKITGVVETAKRQRRAELVAFAVVVEHDVENRLHAARMQGVGRRAHIRPAPWRKARVWRSVDHGIVAPGVDAARARANAARRRKYRPA